MIYKKIAKIKQDLLELEIKKSGKNKYAGFNYFELDDILPHIVMLNNKYGVDDTIQISTDIAQLILTDTEDDTNKVITVPYIEARMTEKNDPIQRLGASITYLRRYLYMTAYNITEKDIIDAMDNTSKSSTPTSQKMQILEAINGTDVRPAEVAGIIKELYHDKIEADALTKPQFNAVMAEINKRINQWNSKQNQSHN